MKNEIQVDLLHHTPLWVTADAIRTCWASQGKSDTKFDIIVCPECECTNYEVVAKTPYTSEHYRCQDCDSLFDEPDTLKVKMGQKDLELIDRVSNKFKHASTIEHLYYNFHIRGISRATLQELARHRIASPSVKSTRYTLKELKNEPPFLSYFDENESQRASKYLVWTGNQNVDMTSFFALEDVRSLLSQGISNDLVKYSLPEAYKTELAWTINARSLQNFLQLRTGKAALWEIQNLAWAVYDKIPEDHKYLFESSVNGAKLQKDQSDQND